MYFSLVSLPEDVNDLNQFSFRENQIEDNTLWKVNGTSYYIHTYNNNLTRISGNFRSKDVVDFKFRYLSDDELYEVARHFLKKGEVTLVRFVGEDEYVEDYSLSGLRIKVYNKKLTESDIKKALEELEYLIKDECLTIDYLQLGICIDGEIKEFTLHSSCAITALLPREEESNELFLNLYKEIIEVLGEKVESFSKVKLKKHKLVRHPLYNQHDFVKELFKHYAENANKKLQLSEKELDLLKKDLLRYTEGNKKSEVYEHIALKIVKELED